MNDGYSEILERISSSSPTPGGGSVSALGLAHSIALSTMVARLTEGREKWSSGHDISVDIISSSAELQSEALSLAHKDSEAFDEVMNAYRMPKNSEEEKKLRSKAIVEATEMATNIPLQTTIACLSQLKKLPALIEHGNGNAVTDAAGAAEFAYASLRLAALNVRINLPGLAEEKGAEINTKLSDLISEADEIIVQCRIITEQRM